MTTTTRPLLSRIDTAITTALGALRAARAACDRSPNAATIAAETEAEDWLNALLDRRHTARH